MSRMVLGIVQRDAALQMFVCRRKISQMERSRRQDAMRFDQPGTIALAFGGAQQFVRDSL